MAKPGVRLQYLLGPGTPPVAVLDPLRVKQVLVNGLTNALKYTGSGTVTLQVRVLQQFNTANGTMHAKALT